MEDLQKDFFKYQAKTTFFASGFEVDRAEGNYIYGKDGKAYLDFVAGVSANTLGHSHPKVIKAIKDQVDKYLHVMVYGEYAMEKPVQICKMLAENLPEPLHTTYLVNSGTEAIEASMKLVKRYTGRQQIISFIDAYHGNSQGSLSLAGRDTNKVPFEPLLPQIDFIRFNEEEDLHKITSKTAGVFVETIQGAAGFLTPKNNYLKKLKSRCEEVGALLALDEIQPGFGRTGKLFAFQWYDIVPDILVMGKGMAGGIPIGAFTTSKQMMESLADNPKLGHITTFGGNPVPAAAACAVMHELLTTDLMDQVHEKEKLFREKLQHTCIRSINGRGLMLAVQLESPEFTLEVAKRCMKNGLIVFWQLYRNEYMRISPPLTITKEEIEKGCEIILASINEVLNERA